jgi:hypothetical protein
MCSGLHPDLEFLRDTMGEQRLLGVVVSTVLGFEGVMIQVARRVFFSFHNNRDVQRAQCGSVVLGHAARRRQRGSSIARSLREPNELVRLL